MDLDYLHRFIIAGQVLHLTPRGVDWRACLHLKGLKKTWLGLWSRTSPDKESWCDRWGWNWNQWSSWLTWRSDSAMPCFHQNCGKVPCTRPPAIDFITNNHFFGESPCTMVAPDFLGTSSVNSLRIGKGHTSSKEPFGNLKEKEWWLAQYRKYGMSKLKHNLRVFLVQCRIVIWTTIRLFYYQEWRYAMKWTSPKIGRKTKTTFQWSKVVSEAIFPTN